MRLPACPGAETYLFDKQTARYMLPMRGHEGLFDEQAPFIVGCATVLAREVDHPVGIPYDLEFESSDGICVFGAGITLSACTTLGPDYQEPEVDWLDDWETALYGQLGTPDAQSEKDLRFWWSLFDDPALNRLIDLARQENPSLRIAGLRILESRAQLGIAGSTLYPQVQQLVGAVDYVNTSQRGGDLPSDSQSFGSYQVQISLLF